MKQEVELKLTGLHSSGEDEKVESAQPAQYFKRNDSHYVLYEEKLEGYDGVCKSRIKFRENLLELTRQGGVEMHMIFEENKRHQVPYQTPYGQLLLGIDTRSVTVEEDEDEIRVTVEYAMDHEGQPLSESSLRLHIRER